MYKEKIINIQTGEETWRDYTSEEIDEIEQAKKERDQRIKQNEERENYRLSALAKLAALGLTEEEIAAL